MGFTLIELLTVMVVSVIVIAVLLPYFGHNGCGSRQLKCSTQIRGIMQGMVIWAQSNNDQYPLPSRIDSANDTVALAAGGTPESKDTSANIMSILIFNGYIPVEMLVTPAESNGKIQTYEGYMFSAPSTAPNPANALWDPAFNADFTGSKPGGLSYAHTFPIGPGADGKPRSRWANTFVSDEAVVGNRGPQIVSVDTSRSTPRAKLANPATNTYLIHGSRATWEGNMGFNDNHVDYLTDPFPQGMTYTDTKGVKHPDCIFYDEPDAAKNLNNYLGIFTKAGPQRKDFIAIWD